MKIAVSGAHRTGKTTLIEELIEALPEFLSRAEAYFELVEAGTVFSEIPVIDDFVTQLEYSITQVTTPGDHVFFDRCPIDMLAYVMACTESEDFDIPSMYQRVQNAMNEIDLLIFVPIDDPDRIGCRESDLPDLRQQ